MRDERNIVMLVLVLGLIYTPLVLYPELIQEIHCRSSCR
jgi:hypothetical protein